MMSSDWNSGKVYYVSPVPRVMRKFRFDMINPYQESLLKSKPRSSTTQYIQLCHLKKKIQEQLAKISTT